MAEIQVSVIFFAKAKELVGKSSGSLSVPTSLQLTHLKTKLVEAFPTLGKLLFDLFKLRIF